MDLSDGNGRKVHPSCQLLRAVVIATGGVIPDLSFNCGQDNPKKPLPTPAAAVGSRVLRGQCLVSAGAVVTAVQRAVAFSYVLQATVVSFADTYVLGSWNFTFDKLGDSAAAV